MGFFHLSYLFVCDIIEVLSCSLSVIWGRVFDSVSFVSVISARQGIEGRARPNCWSSVTLSVSECRSHDWVTNSMGSLNLKIFSNGCKFRITRFTVEAPGCRIQEANLKAAARWWMIEQSWISRFRETLRKFLHGSRSAPTLTLENFLLIAPLIYPLNPAEFFTSNFQAFLHNFGKTPHIQEVDQRISETWWPWLTSSWFSCLTWQPIHQH